MEDRGSTVLIEYDMMEIADGLVWREGIAWDMLEVKEGWHESQRV